MREEQVVVGEQEDKETRKLGSWDSPRERCEPRWDGVDQENRGCPGGSVVKTPPASAGDTQIQSLIWEDSRCHGATQLTDHNY